LNRYLQIFVLLTISLAFFYSIIAYGQTETLLTPLQQLKSGIDVKDIKCKDKLQLMTSSHSGHPACVKQETHRKNDSGITIRCQ
jgi:hypothetical protein